RQPLLRSLLAEQAHRRPELAIGLPVLPGPFVEPAEKLVSAAHGELLVKAFGELYRLLDGSGRIAQPPRLDLQLGEAEQHVALGAFRARLLEVIEGGAEGLLGAAHLALAHQ